MGLSASLQIGNSALMASQLAIQVAGNNLANAATPGYSRQLALLAPTRANTFGQITLGTGVGVSDIRRQVDEALQARLWGGISNEAASMQDHAILAQIEDVLGELGDHNLSGELNAFFNTWSERANATGSGPVVVQQGQRLADFIKRLRGDVANQRNLIDQQLGTRVQRADGILRQIADINRTIADSEAGGAHANTLRDQRDGLISELSKYMDVTTVEQAGGAVDVLIGSTPVVLGTQYRGLELTRRTQNGQVIARVGVKEDGQELAIRSGEIGSLLANRDSTISGVLDRLDSLASQLIFEVNKLHSTGAPPGGLTGTTGTLGFAVADRTRALNDPANATIAGLPFKPVNGGFSVQVKGPGGATQTVRINVKLDGRDPGGAPGLTGNTSLEDIRAALNGIDGLSATITGDGKLKIGAEEGFSFSFADDTSGVLAVLGVNAYFTGSSAADIGVSEALKANPSQLAAGRFDSTGSFIENGTALAIVGVQDVSLKALGGVSLKKHWQDAVQQLGVVTDAAKNQAAASSIVRQSLDAQRAAVSGVSPDEETINLMTFQRQYQGAAKFISVVDEMMQTLISLV